MKPPVVKPRIGLVLGGGGYAGTAFHAGVLTALQHAAGWDARTADIIVGTSAGSTSAALLRSGFPPADYVPRILGAPLSPDGERIMATIGSIPQAPPRPKPGLRPAAPRVAGAMLRDLVERPLGRRRPGRHPDLRAGIALAAILPAGTVPIEAVNPGVGRQFDSWPAEAMWISAISLLTGTRVLFGRDRWTSVAEAVSASCAIPGYFAPVIIDGEPFVDGGGYSACNSDALIDADVDAVLISAPLSATGVWPPDPTTMWRLPFRLSLAREISRLRAAGKEVHAFEPDATVRRIIGTGTMTLARRPAIALAAQRQVTERVGTDSRLRRLLRGLASGADIGDTGGAEGNGRAETDAP